MSLADALDRLEAVTRLPAYPEAEEPPQPPPHGDVPRVTPVPFDDAGGKASSPEGLAEDAEGYPAEPCTCGGGAFHETAAGWRCTRCHPPAERNIRVVGEPWPTPPPGQPRNLDAALRAAVAGTFTTVESLRAALDPTDLQDLAEGRISVETVRMHAAPLNRRAAAAR